MTRAQRDEDFELSQAENWLEEARRGVEWAEKRLEKAKKVAACKHENLDGGGVFGTTCRDCDWYFNDGF